MKKLLLLIFSLAALTFPQDSKNLFELKGELKTTPHKIPQANNNLIYDTPEKKKTGLAIIYSLLLPGMGELYAGSYSSGKYFTIAEGVLWGTFIGMNAYGNWQKDRYKSFAASEGGVQLEGKDDDYFSTISEYSSIEDYNNKKALERSFDEMYDPSTYYWNWQTSENRKTYRSMWVSSEQTFNDVRFVVGALIVNRIASAINAVRLVAAYNNNIHEELSWNLSVGISNPVNLPSSLTLNFQKSF
jgi:TM2 domain-containing membrane protein YozV